MIKFGLFLKVVPSLVIDVIDILFDTIYFGEFVTNGIINKNIHIRPHIYAILFAFQITGKNQVVDSDWLIVSRYG